MGYNGGQKTNVYCYNWDMHGYFSRDCQLPRRTRKKQGFSLTVEEITRIAQEEIDKYNWKTEVKRMAQEWIDENKRKTKDFSVTETNDERYASSRINDVNSENVKPRKSPLGQRVQLVQCRVNSLAEEQRKTSFARFKIEEKNIYGLALIDTGNLVHSALLRGRFGNLLGLKLVNQWTYVLGQLTARV